MPTLTKSLSDFSIKSEWTFLSGLHYIISEGTASKTFNLSSIPKGSTVTGATLTGKVRSQFYTGRFRALYNNSSKTLKSAAGTTAESVNVDVSSWFSGMSTFGDFSVTLAFKETDGHQDVWQSYGYFTDITLTVTYTLPYSRVTAPTGCSLSVSNPGRGKTTTLSWSGAKAGTNNAITGYEVYRSTTTKTGTYTKIAATNASTKSYTITAPNSDVTYYYKVKTLGTVSGYDSSDYSPIATMAMSTTACKAPTAVSRNIASPYPDQTVRISWSGASAGTNNPIAGYQVFEATSSGGTYKKIAEKAASATYHDVTAPQSGARYYKVLTVGTYINSGQSAAMAGFTVDWSNTSDFTFPETAEAGDSVDIFFVGHTDKAHTFTYVIGNNQVTGTVTKAAGTVGLSVSDSGWANHLTDAAEYDVEYRVTTEGAGTAIHRGKITIPADYKPANVTGTDTPVSDSVPAGWGIYVAGQSQAQISVTGATISYSANIVKWGIQGPGVNVAGSSVPLTATSGLLSEGDNIFILSATDTRGRTGTATVTVHAEPYGLPTLQKIYSMRTDGLGTEEDEGTNIIAKAEPVLSSCGGNNSCTVAVYYRQQGQNAWTGAGNLSDVGSDQWELEFGSNGVSTQYNWDVKYVITDALGNTGTYFDIVTRAVWELHIKKGGGAWAFGGPADVNGALHVYGGLKLDTPLTIANGGTGANTKANAKTALDIDDLEANLGGVKFIRRTANSSGGKVTYTFTNYCAFVILCSGANANVRATIYGNVTSSGTVTTSKVDVGSNPGLSVSTSANKLVLTNSNTNGNSYTCMIVFYGTAPTAAAS